MTNQMTIETRLEKGTEVFYGVDEYLVHNDYGNGTIAIVPASKPMISMWVGGLVQHVANTIVVNIDEIN